MALLVLVQSAFLPPFFRGPVPVLIFMYSLALLSLKRYEKAYFSAFIGGILLDFLMPVFLGRSSIIFLVFLISVYYVKKYLFDNVLLYLIAIPLFSVVWSFVSQEGSAVFDQVFVLWNFISFGLFYLLILKLDLKRDSEHIQVGL